MKKVRTAIAIILFSVMFMAGEAFPEESVSDGSVGAESTAVSTGAQESRSGQLLRYFHPLLSVTGAYSDNILASNTDRKSDFVTVISPGIWLSAPLRKERPALIDSSSMTPGGFLVEDMTHRSFRHFQSFLFYQADIQRYNHYSSENNVTHRLEGQLEYVLRGGLSAALLEQYLVSHDQRGTGFTDTLTKYHSNLLSAAVTYDTRHKVLLRAGYSNFVVDYNQPESSFRKRTDNTFSAYVFYAVQPKTDLFLEYRFIDIAYDHDSLLDGEENQFFAGLRWDISSKTQGFLKAGYGTKSFDSHDDTSNNFIFESGVDMQVSGRGALSISAWRKTNETNLESSLFILTNGVKVGYTHKLTGKLSAFADLSYEHDSYNGNASGEGITDKQTDRYTTAGIGIRHKFRRWLTNEIGYTYAKRDSTSRGFDYSSNTFYFRISAGL